MPEDTLQEAEIITVTQSRPGPNTIAKEIKAYGKGGHCEAVRVAFTGWLFSE